MWNEFYLAAALTAGLLYVPGYLFWRGVSLSPLLALVCAPLFGAAVYGALPIAYYELHVPCNLITVAGPALVIAVIAYVLHRSRADEFDEPVSFHADTLRIGSKSVPLSLTAILYVALAAVLTYVIFVRHLPSPDAFVSRYDNQTHLNAVRSYLDSGKWSVLHESPYLASPANAIPVASNAGSFYPTGWHILACLVCDAIGVGVTTGINATLLAICCTVVPLGAFGFFRALFPEKPAVVLLGAIAAFSFPNWPWNCFVTGPLYPNLYGLALMLSTIALVVTLIEERLFFAHLGTVAALVLTSLAALGTAHPNTVFSLYVFMAFYGASVIGRAIRKSERLSGVLRWLAYVVALAAYAAAVTAAWIGFYHVPIIANVIGFVPSTLKETIAQGNPLQAAITSLRSKTEYLIVALAGLLGCIPLARNEEKWPAIVGPTAFFAVAYAFVKMGLEQASFWTAAPWYSDSRRLALNVAVFGAPLIAVVLDLLMGLPAAIMARRAGDEVAPVGRHGKPAAAAAATTSPLATVCSLVMLAGVCAAIWLWGFGDVMEKFSLRYSTGDHIYSGWESDFVSEAAEITGDDLVLNMPHDGSLWAYGVNGMNTYFRSVKLKEQNDDAVLIREKLAEYAKNDEVQAVVKRTGAKYVMLLDKDIPYEDGLWLQQYTEKAVGQWSGLSDVDDDTPGFELVLSKDDDMRLYRIVDAG